MRAIPAYTVLFVAFISLQSASADTIDAADRTQRHTVKSTALGEKREIFVRTPPNYRGDGPCRSFSLLTPSGISNLSLQRSTF